MAERPSGVTESTMFTLTARPAASLAASVLLSCVLAPAHAHQPAPNHSAAGCPAAGKPCPAASAAARARPKQEPECGRLRAAILEAEHSERRVRAAMMESVQLDLLSLRKRYRKLGCRAAART